MSNLQPHKKAYINSAYTREFYFKFGCGCEINYSFKHDCSKNIKSQPLEEQHNGMIIFYIYLLFVIDLQHDQIKDDIGKEALLPLIGFIIF